MCLLFLAAFGEQFLCFRSLGCLDLEKQSRHLVWCPSLATQQRIERTHEQHLQTDKFGENVHLHFAPDDGCCAAEQKIARPFARRFAISFGRRKDSSFFFRRELRPDASGTRHASSQPWRTWLDYLVVCSHRPPNEW